MDYLDEDLTSEPTVAPSGDYDNHHHGLTGGQIGIIIFSAFAVLTGAYKCMHPTIYEDGYQPIDHY